jgi:hypothetical protein
MAMLLADALPMGIIGAVLQATKALVAVRARARGMNRKLFMTDSWLVDEKGNGNACCCENHRRRVCRLSCLLRLGKKKAGNLGKTAEREAPGQASEAG